MVDSTRRFVVCLSMCHFVLVFFSPFRLSRLGKRELILVLFVRLFDLCLFGFVDFLFLFGSVCVGGRGGGRGWGRRFVIMALPGLFSYLFLKKLWRI